MIERPSARLILLDPRNRLFLFNVHDPAVFDPADPFHDPFWVMIGGLVDPGEGFVQAAVREAVAKGCRVTHAALNQDVATIDLTPASPADAIIPFLANMGYVDPGVGGFQIEFIAASNPERHRDMFPISEFAGFRSLG